MAIALGGNQISKAYLGTTEIQRMYLGSDLVFDNTVPPISLTPIMTNFRIEVAQDSRIYFDTPLGAPTAFNTLSSFIISDGTRTITGVNLEAGTSGHYFTVSSAFTYYYKAETIRLEGGTEEVYDFTMEYIVNNIAEPTATTERWITVLGGGLHDGTSEANAWTFDEAKTAATSDMHVWMKAGTYSSNTTYITNDGGLTTPIKFVGYTSAEGDLDNDSIVDDFVYTTPENAATYVDPTKYPVIQGANVNPSYGMFLNAAKFRIFKNIQVRSYQANFQIYGASTDVVFINCTAALSTNGEAAGWLSGATTTARRISNDKCLAFDNGGKNNRYIGASNAIINSSSYSGTNTDYHYSLYESDYTVIHNNLSKVVGGTNNGDHGYSIKGAETTSNCRYNLFQANISDGNTGENFSAAHQLTSNNVFKDNESINGSGPGLVARNGADHNIFEYNRIESASYSIYIWANGENVPVADGSMANNNIFRNNIFSNAANGVVTSNSSGSPLTCENNVIENNTFYNIAPSTAFPYGFFYTTATNVTFSGNQFRGNILHTVADMYRGTGSDTQWVQTLNNYYLTESVPSGTGNISINPEFEDLVDFVPGADGLKIAKLTDYDFNKTVRADDSSMGGVKLPSESSGGGTNYYVSALGNDNNDGITAPWQTINEVNNRLIPVGSTVSFNGGDKFTGTLITSSGVNYTSYGTGRAEINNETIASGWTDQGSDIYTLEVADPIYQVFKNNVRLNNSRSDGWEITEVVYEERSYRFTIPALTGQPSLVGATMQVASDPWSYESGEVTVHNTTTGQVTFPGDTFHFGVDVGMEMTILNDVSMMATQDDWVYRGTTLSVYSPSGTPTGVSYSANNSNGITIDNCSDINVNGLSFSKINHAGTQITNSANIMVTDNEYDLCYLYAVQDGACDPKNNFPDCADWEESTGVTITNNIINRTNKNSIVSFSPSTIIVDNTTTENGRIDELSYHGPVIWSTAITSFGDDTLVEYNTLEELGYLGIDYYGLRSLVRKNYIHNYCLDLSDGGAIYTNNYLQDFNQTTMIKGSILSNNIMEIDVTRNSQSVLTGIYGDYMTQDVTMIDNTVINGKDGLFLGGNKDLAVSGNNVLLKNGSGISPRAINVSKIVTDADGNVVTSNTFMVESEDTNSRAVSAFSNVGSTTDYTEFNSNFVQSILRSDIQYDVQGSNLDLAAFNTYFDTGDGLNVAGDQQVAGNHTRIYYNKEKTQQVVSIDAGTWYEVDGTTHTTSVTLEPFTSIILTDVDLSTQTPDLNLIRDNQFTDTQIWQGHPATLPSVITINNPDDSCIIEVNSSLCFIGQDVTYEAGETYEITYQYQVSVAGKGFSMKDSNTNDGGLINVPIIGDGTLQTHTSQFTATATSNNFFITRETNENYTIVIYPITILKQ